MCFSIGFNKYHIAREKGLDIPGYRSPSIIMGLALFCLGSITLGPFFDLALPFVKMQLSIKILFWMVGLGLFFLFAGLAFLNRYQERKL
ncbi:hypothetical protein KDK_69500 [Dictyobacter kobayashii]|uniref:NADH:quinone oxidoreductase/Mrp antiporter membrane subunit domain-containing protein n=2 Tax=Dictyobacter kobayashii TaxID=2014872 RepID=A0A402AVI0_9CHLR|nr:hypothetical protein KDK_69500 [Dictyobacter kobayashii]